MNRRILVVDDTEEVRDQLKAFLEQDGAEVETACDARTALALARTRPFQLLITDLRMPGMSGLDLLAAATGTPPWRSRP
jgi:CheY-like chemotaxis protein